MAPERKGVFIVLEGSDGSGKGTQFNLLTERLKAVGYDVATHDFPRYDQGSSHFVRQYLNGDYGPAAEISPYTASLFYALDRYEASQLIVKDLEDGKVVLANRYVGSNMAHQGSKFTNPVEQRGFFVWNDNLEYELLKLPRPDINLFLRVPAKVSYDLIEKKAARSYTSAVRDEHEANMDHLKKAVATYDLLCQLFPKDFKAIECVKDGKLLSIPAISDLIWNKIKPLLPADKPKPSHSAVVTLGETEPAAPKPSRKDAPNHLTVLFKTSSLLLRLEIEKAYPGSTTPKTSFWSDSNYDFYTPQGLSKDQKAVYKTALERMAKSHADILAGLESYYQKSSVKKPDPARLSYLMQPLTPLAAVIPFEVSLEKSEVLPLAQTLLESDLAEAQWASKQIYLMAREVWPQDFKRPLESSDDAVSIGSILAKLAPAGLSAADDSQAVRILEASPRQEFDLVAESVYPFSSLSLSEITAEVAEWPYQQKYDSLRRAASQPSVLREVRYKMDVISDQISLGELAQAAGLQHLQSQAISPRYGFAVPAVFDDSGLDEQYNGVFDESLSLYSSLQSGRQDDYTAYAALVGHKIRWQLNASAADLFAAYQKRPSAAKKLLNRILESVAEIHPVLWDVLTNDPAPQARSSQGSSRVKPYHQRRKSGRSKPKKS